MLAGGGSAWEHSGKAFALWQAEGNRQWRGPLLAVALRAGPALSVVGQGASFLFCYSRFLDSVSKKGVMEL